MSETNQNLLKPSISLLDDCDPDSALNKSGLRGFYNCFFTFTILFLGSNSQLNYLESGEPFDLTLFNLFKKDFLLCLVVWPCYATWSYCSLAIQLLIVRGLPINSALVLQHCAQSILFSVPVYFALFTDWCTTHLLFLSLQTCVHFMKMHSFSQRNRDLREGKGKSGYYPGNLTVKQFGLYLLTPVLIYREDCPRRNNIRWSYCFLKFFKGTCAIFTAYAIFTNYVVFDRPSFIQSVLRTVLPVCFLVLVLIYFVFQCFTNFFGEITKLADRNFYSDYWNSSHFAEFNKKWNSRVYQFLYFHVFRECVERHGLSKSQAQAFTFFFSALLHQYVITVTFGQLAPVLLAFMMIQIPLFLATRPYAGLLFGRVVFVFGFILGPGLVMACYYQIIYKSA